MSQGASDYPIQQFLRRLIEQYGPTPSGFVTTLGYRNIDRGLRRLELWLQTGEGFHRIIDQIAGTYTDYADKLRTAIGETQEMKVAEVEAAFFERCKAEADTFHPYIHVDGETTRPSSITMFGLMGGRSNMIEIPQTILDLPLDEQLVLLPELMRAYLEKYRGLNPFFGAVTGFKFCRCLDYFQFDREGRLVEHVHEPFRRGSCSVSLR